MEMRKATTDTSLYLHNSSCYCDTAQQNVASEDNTQGIVLCPYIPLQLVYR